MSNSTKSQRHILTELHKGATIIVDHIRESDGKGKRGGRTVHRLSSTNETIPWEVISGLVASKLIKPNYDGLPGFEVTQSYSIWRPSEGGA